jgi:hypothetical protein
VRPVAILLVALVACGGSSSNGGGRSGETAAERARREHAESGEDDAAGKGKAWAGWRYKGSRDECFFVVGRTCFTELKAACKAAKCKKATCETRGGGPAEVSCRKK